jgi:hypothetical protein
MTAFFEIGFRLTAGTDESATPTSICRYKETSFWESGPLPILVALLLSRFALFFASLLLVLDAITSGDSLLLVAGSFSLPVVCVDCEVHVAGGFPFF